MMKTLAYVLLLVFGSSSHVMASNWRERLVPSFEGDHESENAPGDPFGLSLTEATLALQQLQASNKITEDLISDFNLPFLPEVTDFNMTMSDGVQVWTRVVNPWPHDSKKPACLVRSPYGSMFTQNIGLIYLALNGHAAVMQEVRGTWSSGGTFDLFRHSSSDATDTIAWITGQKWSDGDVYSVGGSADGIEALEEVIANPKELRGEWLIYAPGNGHQFAYPGGAYRKDLMSGYLNGLSGMTRGASADLVLPATKQHEALDPWWYNITACADVSDSAVAPGCRYGNVKWPMVLNAGWFDIFHETMLDMWFGIREHSDPTVRDDHVLIVAPLGHNTGGKLEVGKKESARLKGADTQALIVGGELTSEFWKWQHCSYEWTFDNTCYCQGRVRFGRDSTWTAVKNVNGSIKCDTNHFDDPWPLAGKECQCQQPAGALRKRIGRVNLFIMGSFGAEDPVAGGNYWTSLHEFPKTTAKDLFLSGGSSLADTLPTATGSSSYLYDPHDPGPMIGGNNLPGFGSIEFAGSANQLPRENRSDILVFDSAPLAADLPVVGAVSATVFVSSNATDTDFFVTVSDLHPDASKSMLVRYGIQRMRWRGSETKKSEPMMPGEVYEVKISLGYTAYIFPKGHRIRVSVSSAADPYFNPTSNTGENDLTTKVEPVSAKNAVHFSTRQPSRLTLPTAALKDIPPNPWFTPIGPFTESSAEHILV